MKNKESCSTTLAWLTPLLLSALVVGCGEKDPILGTSGIALLAPTVTTTVPLAKTPIAADVAINSRITATFSKDMASATINTSSFTVACPAGSAIAGTVSYVASSHVATFAPSSSLPPQTTCTATLSTKVADTVGLTLVKNVAWSFVTGVAPDITRPVVTLEVPVAGATNVAFNAKVIATFSEDMDPTTIKASTFTLKGPNSTPVVGTVTYAVDSRIATFTPTTPSTLPANTLFTATVTTGAEDLAGNALAGSAAALPAASNFVWTFTTGAASDVTPPLVTLVNPANLSVTSCPQDKVNVAFNETMDSSTITSDTFTLQVTGVNTLLDGSVTYNALNKVATFNPTLDLLPATNYTATLKTGVKDLAGNALTTKKTWTFTTASALSCSPVPPIALGAAAAFGTFGGSAGMTNQGILTVINGDIGTTAVSTAVTGFHDMTPQCIYTETGSNKGTVNGLIYTAAPPPTVGCPSEGTALTFSVATKARADALTAYNALVAKPSGSDSGAGSLANLVLAPGVYTAAAGSFKIQGGDLTLDAQGNSNATWVFQMASTLTVGGPGAAFPQSIVLINGAQAKNVFWQVGTAATINAGGGGTMAGTIIAQDGVTISTSGNVAVVTLNGRALSLGASVTLVNTVINVPAP
ncbi:MAG: ice-binding family protein [Agitococcus sp.]|nr:ice-binding family protein [Agitococcus sp.]